MKAIILNILGFNIVWTALVLGAAHGRAWIGVPAYVLFAACQLWASPHHRRELQLTLVVAPAGWLVDSLYVALGLLQYAQPWPGPPFAPWWIAALWANFVLLLNHSLTPFRRRQALVAALGMVGGPLTYLTAARLGAVTFGPDWLTALLVLALVWSAAVPLLFRLDEMLQRQPLIDGQSP